MDSDKNLGNKTEEQITKAEQCSDSEQFPKSTGTEDVELTDKQLDEVAGGGELDGNVVQPTFSFF